MCLLLCTKATPALYNKILLLADYLANKTTVLQEMTNKVVIVLGCNKLLHCHRHFMT